MSEAVRLILILIDDHWILGVLSDGETDLLVYKPCPSLENCDVIKVLVLLSLNTSLGINFMALLLQSKGDEMELEVILLVVVFCTVLYCELPCCVDYKIWRHVIYALLSILTNDNIDHRMVEIAAFRSNVIGSCNLLTSA